jgi:hypothetical protein
MPSVDEAPVVATVEGQFRFVHQRHRDPTRTRLTVVLNWFDELQRLVPAP